MLSFKVVLFRCSAQYIAVRIMLMLMNDAECDWIVTMLPLSVRMRGVLKVAALYDMHSVTKEFLLSSCLSSIFRFFTETRVSPGIPVLIVLQ